MRNGLIAIIDNDELDRYIYKKIILLTCPTYRLIDFSNGIDALNYMEKNAAEPTKLPDILLLDVRMPNLSGWEYLEQYCAIKSKLAKTIRHYICTSSIERFQVDSKNINLSGYYVKPISPKDILTIIDDAEQQYDQGAQDNISTSA